MQTLTQTPEWQALQQHQKTIALTHMRDFFAQEKNRAQQFCLSAAEITLDFSKNRIRHETMQLLCQLAQSRQLASKIEDLFNGKMVNWSENRPALHTALRDLSHSCVWVDGHNIMPEIKDSLLKMENFCHQAQQGELRGYTQQPITHIVNIGIGGSDLGPAMAIEALKSWRQSPCHFHFISNIDSQHSCDVLSQLDPATTLFIVTSKSFKTIETLTNANIARQWLQQAMGSEQAFHHHFIAITANPQKALQFGFTAEQIFPLWDWVGGRFSLWSSCGLPVALALGMENFKALLRGAYAMDQHFRTAAIEQNIPVILALLSIWYTNFFAAQTHAVIPYCHALRGLPAYLQQLEMESNGKTLTSQGILSDYATAPIIWGDVGCNSQHSFHQLLHQSHLLIPVDFILPIQNPAAEAADHAFLFASCLSQSQTLMQGLTCQEVMQTLQAQGMNEISAQKQAPYLTIAGNRPNNIILLEKLTPFVLGALIAMYEHKTFVQGAIWDINSFDQWGIELSKQLTTKIHVALQASAKDLSYDSSTNYLMQRFRNQ